MWCIPREVKSTNDKIMEGMERRGFYTVISKKALLVSGEIDDLKGCTNDIIEYAIMLSRVYKYKEIRVLQSEVSERLYGNFLSFTLNQLEGGTIVQILRLTRNSLLEGFRWLLSTPLNVNDYMNMDFSVYYNIDLKSNNRGLDPYYNGNELVFVYSGKARLAEIMNEMGKEPLYEPQFHVSKEEQVFFTEIENILTSCRVNGGKTLTNITCFMDCEYGHLFLPNYTGGLSIEHRNYLRFEKNTEISHMRTKTLPETNVGRFTQEERIENNAEENFIINVDEREEANINNDKISKINTIRPIFVGIRKNIPYDPNISVVIFSSCLESQMSQEISVCSNNGLNLSIIYRGLFSYSFHSFIKQSLMAYNPNSGNLGKYQMHNGGFNNRNPLFTGNHNNLNFTLEYVLEELKRNMSYLVNKSQLNEQFPVLTTSSNITCRKSKLFQVSFNEHINASGFSNTINNHSYYYGYIGHNRNITSESRLIHGLGNNKNCFESATVFSYPPSKMKQAPFTFPPQIMMENSEDIKLKYESSCKVSSNKFTFHPQNDIFGKLLSKSKRVYATNKLENNSDNHSFVHNSCHKDNNSQYEHSVYPSESLIIEELTKLKNELDLIRKSVTKNQNAESHLDSGNYNNYGNIKVNRGNISNNYMQQLYNTNSVFKRSIKNQIGATGMSANNGVSGHFRTFTSK